MVRCLSSFGDRDHEILSLFLAGGANPNERSNNSSGGMRSDYITTSFPITSLARNGSAKALKLLLESGAAVDSRYEHHGAHEYGGATGTSETPLHIAIVQNQSLEKVKLLLEWKADINATRKHIENVTIKPDLPFHHGDPRSEGFVSNIKNVHHEGSTLHLAIISKNRELVRYLVVNNADTSKKYIKTSRRVVEESLTCFELCNNDHLLESALEKQFKESDLNYLNQTTYQSIKSLLLCIQRNNWKLPKDVLFKIIGFLIFQ